MNIQQIGFTYPKNLWMMLSNNILDFWHFIYEEWPSFVPMADFDPFATSVSIGVSWLKICYHIEEVIEEDADTANAIWEFILRTGVYSWSGRGFTEIADL